MKRDFFMLAFAVTLSSLLTSATVGTSASSAQCAYGAYQSPAGELIAITPPLPGKSVARFTLLNGRRGNTDDANSPARCENRAYVGTDAAGKAFVWKRLAFRETPTTFDSDGVKLYGMLLEPISAAKPPLIVFVHGSEKQSPIELYYQLLYTSQGVATFFYDKRGTGRSQGTYTQDFMVLADDAANAARAARKLAAGRFSRLGFYGGSQGGWVAPLAALKAHADFLEVGFGCVCTPLEQDVWQVDYQLLHEDGFSSNILSAVHRVTAATADVIASDAPNAHALDAIKKRYAGEPWFSKIDGQYSGDLLKGNIPEVYAENNSLHVPWRYSGLDILRELRIPQLWIFAQDDTVAPSANSIARLTALTENAGERWIVRFPHTDHGILTYHVDGHGQHVSDGNVASGYLRLLSDFAKGTLSGSYGDAEWIRNP